MACIVVSRLGDGRHGAKILKRNSSALAPQLLMPVPDWKPINQERGSLSRICIKAKRRNRQECGNDS